MAMQSGNSSNGYSGTNYDRWAYEHSAPGANDTALNKLQRKYWVTKQAVVRKLGKDEDEHFVASDMELDAKLELYRSINDTTCGLQRMIEHYQDRLCNLVYEESCLGRFLKEFGKADKTKAGKMMVAVGKTMSYSGQQRMAIRVPLVRLYQEVETFRQRAIEDTLITIRRMEKSRTEYRGALMWMKNVSQELDPDTYKQLEKFRKVQGHVKQSKAKFDKLKLDCLQKVDLLAASRCNMFSHALIMYQDALINFWEKTARTMTHVNDSFQGYQHYEFTYIKDLAEPSKKLATDDGKKDSEDDKMDRQKREDLSATSNTDLLNFEIDQDKLGAAIENVDKLLNFEDEEEVFDPDKDKLQGLPTLAPMAPMPKPKDQDDVQLLDELMNGPKEPEKTGFSAQWNKLFGQTDPEQSSTIMSLSNVEDDEFGQFISARGAIGEVTETEASESISDLLSNLPMGSSSSQETKSASANKSFLPSQLFDLNQSLHAPNRLSEEDLLRDFPMPSPAKPASVQRQLSSTSASSSSTTEADKRKKMKDMSQWFSLFADLDPLANPDAIGKTTKEGDSNCYS